MRRRIDLALLVVMGAIAFLALTPQSADEKHLKLVPFSDILHSIHRPSGLLTVIGNVVVFVPVGFLLALRTTFARAVVGAAAFSATIELVQLAIPGRTTSIDDLMLNTLGAAVGALLVRRGLVPHDLSG